MIEQLQPDIDDSNWPRIYLKSLEIKNFGKFDHIFIDFSSATPDCIVEPLTCFIGPNGTGKTTVLTATQLLFSSYDGYDNERFRSNMLKYVRNSQINCDILDKDFMVKGIFEDNNKKQYAVELTRLNRILSFHPDFIAERLPHYCFFTRFDQELHTFQLKRDRWGKFKLLFESITGYEIEEDTTLFDASEDTRINNLLQEYVMSFNIKKPEETISHKQCSAGERKIIKTFSTVLNKSVTPNIILIDNAVMHVEVDRHISVLNAIKKCFNRSQVIITCHSEPIKRNLSSKKLLIDMRFASLPQGLVENPYRLRVADELKDIKDKLQYSSLADQKRCVDVINQIDELSFRLMNNYSISESEIRQWFISVVSYAYKIIEEDLLTSYLPPIKNLN